MRVALFVFLGQCLVSAAAAAANAPCALPDLGDPYTSAGGCPQFQWSAEDGGFLVHDNGEALWADSTGVLHIAKRMTDVPEPYRSMYHVLQQQADGSFAIVDDMPLDAALPPEAEAASPNGAALARDHIAWRKEITWWRAELYASTRALLQAVLHPYGNAYNPLAFAYMPDRELTATAQDENAAAARARVLRARAMLVEGLPQKARAEGVPLQWLQ